MKSLFRRFLSFLYGPKVFLEHIKAHRAANLAQMQLTLVQDNLDAIDKHDILLIATVFNEARLLPEFIRYYRQLGVHHFIFIDNNSDDQGLALVTMDNDVSVFHTRDSYKNANFGMHWVNGLLKKYGSDHWCIVCDIDEHLVFSEPDVREGYFDEWQTPLQNLCQRLEHQHNQAFYTIMLDMYPGHIKATTDSENEAEKPLLETTPYFDKSGYTRKFNIKYLSQMIRGGVRQRLLYQQTPDKAPALQKIPLVKWQENYVYLSSMHTLSPRRLNLCFSQQQTGALLHFKFSPGYITKIVQEQTRQQHYDNSSEYRRYQQMLGAQAFFDAKLSSQYSDAGQLESLHLIKSLSRQQTMSESGVLVDQPDDNKPQDNGSGSSPSKVAKNG